MPQFTTITHGILQIRAASLQKSHKISAYIYKSAKIDQDFEFPLAIAHQGNRLFEAFTDVPVIRLNETQQLFRFKLPA